MSRSVEIEVLKGYSPWNWLGGKVDVTEGTIYTVSMYLKFVDKVPNCKDDNFGLKKHSPQVFYKTFMEGIVADQWTYVEWSFTAENSSQSAFGRQLHHTSLPSGPVLLVFCQHTTIYFQRLLTHLIR